MVLISDVNKFKKTLVFLKTSVNEGVGGVGVGGRDKGNQRKTREKNPNQKTMVLD